MTEIPTRILVEALVPADGPIDAAQLYAVGNRLGMTDQQVRLGIRRAVAAGQLELQGRGRNAQVRATAALRAALEPDAQFLGHAYAQDKGSAPWDGRWHVVSFAIAETERSARDAMRAGIVRLGGAAVQGGVYLSPNAWEPYIARLAVQLGTTGSVSTLTTTDLRIGGVGEPRRIAARLWPLSDIAAAYERLLEAIGDVEARLPAARQSPIERTVLALQLAYAFTRAIEPDPLLPPELLPQPWAGRRARAAFAETWGRLEALAAEPAAKLFTLYGTVIPAAGRSS